MFLFSAKTSSILVEGKTSPSTLTRRILVEPNRVKEIHEFLKSKINLDKEVLTVGKVNVIRQSM